MIKLDQLKEGLLIYWDSALGINKKPYASVAYKGKKMYLCVNEFSDYFWIGPGSDFLQNGFIISEIFINE